MPDKQTSKPNYRKIAVLSSLGLMLPSSIAVGLLILATCLINSSEHTPGCFLENPDLQKEKSSSFTYFNRGHFTWYDILLNILGGILGLLIIRGIKR